MFMDNQSAMQVAKNPEHHGHMKHLDLRYFCLWDEVNCQCCIGISYTPTADMAADLLTKPLGCIKVGIALTQSGVPCHSLVAHNDVLRHYCCHQSHHTFHCYH
jgi:hypothetical protein